MLLVLAVETSSICFMDECSSCPMKLFNDKCHNLPMIGNPCYGRLVVIPSVDCDAYKNRNLAFSSQVRMIVQSISSTGELDDFAVVPLIRCNRDLGCDVNADILRRCMMKLSRDIAEHDFRDILLLGDSVRYVLGCNIQTHLNELFISQHQTYTGIITRRYGVNYSPLVSYIDEDRFDQFQKYLKKWYYSSKAKDYRGYKLCRL